MTESELNLKRLLAQFYQREIMLFFCSVLQVRENWFKSSLEDGAKPTTFSLKQKVFISSFNIQDGLLAQCCRGICKIKPPKRKLAPVKKWHCQIKKIWNWLSTALEYKKNIRFKIFLQLNKVTFPLDSVRRKGKARYVCWPNSGHVSSKLSLYSLERTENTKEGRGKCSSIKKYGEKSPGHVLIDASLNTTALVVAVFNSKLKRSGWPI